MVLIDAFPNRGFKLLGTRAVPWYTGTLPVATPHFIESQSRKTKQPRNLLPQPSPAGKGNSLNRYH
jgi:hypothetical protein